MRRVVQNRPGRGNVFLSSLTAFEDAWQGSYARVYRYRVFRYTGQSKYRENNPVNSKPQSIQPHFAGVYVCMCVYIYIYIYRLRHE